MTSQGNNSDIGNQVGDLINQADQRTIGPASVGTNLLLWSGVSVCIPAEGWDSMAYSPH